MYSIVYTTISNSISAREISKEIINARLAACVNIINNATSIYEWQGEIKEDAECLLLIKTKTSLADEVISFIRNKHPYDIPAISSFSLDNVDDAYAKWVEGQTR